MKHFSAGWLYACVLFVLTWVFVESTRCKCIGISAIWILLSLNIFNWICGCVYRWKMGEDGKTFSRRIFHTWKKALWVKLAFMGELEAFCVVFRCKKNEKCMPFWIRMFGIRSCLFQRKNVHAFFLFSFLFQLISFRFHRFASQLKNIELALHTERTNERKSTQKLVQSFSTKSM